jgi:hypothetical protein
MYRIRQEGMGGYDVLVDPLGYAKAHWCLSFPTLCTKDNYQASMAYLQPSTIAPIQTPPVVTSPVGDPLTVPPADAAQAQALIDAQLAQQLQAWKDQNAATIAQTQANLDKAGTAYDMSCLVGSPVQNADGTWSCSLLPAGTNWLLYGGIAAGVLGLLMIRGQGERSGR